MTATENGYFSGARLLATDARVTLLLLREIRGRACERLFGVSREDSALVTFVALATLAHAVRNNVHEAMTGPWAPTRSDAVIGMGALKEGVHWIAGDWSREVPVLPALILASVIGHHLRPWLGLSLHDVRAVSHRIRTDFDRRYGHLIRQNRAQPSGAKNLP
jgi:hypothetical protein